MLGTRGRTRAQDQQLHPDETEPAHDIPMVADYGPNDPAQPGEPNQEQEQAAGVIHRTTRSLADFWAGRSTPGTRTSASEVKASDGMGGGASGKALPSRSEVGNLMEQIKAQKAALDKREKELEATFAALQRQASQLSGKARGKASVGRLFGSPSRGTSAGDSESNAGDDDDLIDMSVCRACPSRSRRRSSRSPWRCMSSALVATPIALRICSVACVMRGCAAAANAASRRNAS